MLVTAALLALVLLTGVGMYLSPRWVTPGWGLFILLLGVFALRLPAMLVLAGAVLAEIGVLALLGRATWVPGAYVVLLGGTVAALVFVRSRDRLGLQGAAGELMLVDLRDRLVQHGRIPDLPAGWRVDGVVRSAHGDAFSGDFVVAARTEGGRLLEIVLVDVSGKGQEAGVRSLLLSGAFGGLLGAMPREQFLPAANAYLLGQGWHEGFATAVHLSVRLDTGHFWVAIAGHPPVVHLHAGSGAIAPIDARGGPALGIVAAPAYPQHAGVLERGDTLMLYTDGLVETPGGDLDLGIDRLMGVAEHLVATRRGDAAAVLAGVHAGDDDDRALVLVHRDR